MPISFQPSNKAELRVEVGKTSVEELAKFQKDVASQGGGEIRAKKNDDGSHTLYVAADSKVRLSAIFGERWGGVERTEKRDLAKDLMKEIISRRLPGDSEGATSALLGRIDQRGTASRLGEVLGEVSSATFEEIPEEAVAQYKKLDTIMSTPVLREAFGKDMERQYAKESFDFLNAERAFAKATNPHEKLALAKEMAKMVETPGAPVVAGINVGAAGPVQINISGQTASKVHQDLAHLTTAIQTGQEPSAADKLLLDQLFSGAKREVTRMVVSDHQVGRFTSGDAFKTAAATVHAEKVFSEHDANPASYLRPGSGEEFAAAQDHFATLENVLDDPQMRAAYKEHAGPGKAEAFTHLEAVEALATLAESDGVSDAEMLKNLEDFFITADPEEGEVDPHQEMLRGKLAGLREKHEILGGTPTERAEQERLFGADDQGGKKETLIRGPIKEFLGMMKGDALNGLRGRTFEGFQGAKADTLIGDRMFREQLDGRPGGETQLGSWDRFAGKELQGSGGATGSGQGKVGKQLFQVKGSIEHAGFGRRMKAGGLNTENYGEVISSNISRALVGPAARGQIPHVALRQDGNAHEAMVTSEYLKNGKGDLKDLYKELAGPLPRGQKHPRVHLDSVGPSGGGILRLSGTASRDVQRNIALSALMGDHDVNPGNMIALKDGHVGRIDFGHAFNELITGPGGAKTGGGGVQNKENRILDYFNREKISGVPFTGQQTPKLWRDYTGAGPSDGMTSALREMASSTESLDGVNQAKTQFTDLIKQLQSEGTPEAEKQLRDVTDSLARISRNIEKPITATDPLGIADQVFGNVELFVQEGQAQMKDVANLSELQTKIDTHINATREHPEAAIPDDILAAYNTLAESSVKTEGGAGLNWMKITKDTPAVKGNLDLYIAARRQELRSEA